MKKKNLIIIAAVAVIGVVALLVARTGARKATFDQDFHIEDIDAVTKIFIADKQNQHVTLQRVGDTTQEVQWTVDTLYPASQPMVDMLLETLHDMRIRQQVNKNAVPQVVKQLSARAVKVDVYEQRYFINWFGGRLRLFLHEKRTVTYYVGQETQDQMACFMFRKGDKAPFIIHIPGFRGFLTPRFVADQWAWRSHTIVHWDIRRIDKVELEIPEDPAESFAIHRQGDGFSFELTQSHTTVPQFDTARVAQMLSCFANLNFDEFCEAVPNANPDSTMAFAPRTILRITNTEGTTREVKTYLKYSNPDDRLAMPDTAMYNMFDLNRLYAVIDSKDTVLIQYFVFDNILQPASYFLGQQKDPFAKQ